MLKATSQRSPSVIKKKKIPDERKQAKAEKYAAAAGKSSRPNKSEPITFPMI
jgi:hypothetical protein